MEKRFNVSDALNIVLLPDGNLSDFDYDSDSEDERLPDDFIDKALEDEGDMNLIGLDIEIHNESHGDQMISILMKSKSLITINSMSWTWMLQDSENSLKIQARSIIGKKHLLLIRMFHLSLFSLILLKRSQHPMSILKCL